MSKENRKKKRSRFARDQAAKRRAANNGGRSIPIIGQHHGAKNVDPEMLDVKGLPTWMRHLTASEKKKSAAFFLITSGYAQATDAQKGMSVEALEFARELAFLRQRVHVAFDTDQTDDVVVRAAEAMTTGGVCVEEAQALLARLIFDMRFKAAIKILFEVSTGKAGGTAFSDLLLDSEEQKESREWLDLVDRFVNPTKYEEEGNVIRDSLLSQQKAEALAEQEGDGDGDSKEGTDGPEDNEETEA